MTASAVTGGLGRLAAACDGWSAGGKVNTGMERAADADDAIGDPGRDGEWVVGIVIATAQEGGGAEGLESLGCVSDSCLCDSSGGGTLEAASWDGWVREVRAWESVGEVGAA